jgi:hypothetical protein
MVPSKAVGSWKQFLFTRPIRTLSNLIEHCKQKAAIAKKKNREKKDSSSFQNRKE